MQQVVKRAYGQWGKASFVRQGCKTIFSLAGLLAFSGLGAGAQSVESMSRITPQEVVPTAVPEPASAVLVLVGLVVVIALVGLRSHHEETKR